MSIFIKIEPQINADERGFVDSDIQRKFVTDNDSDLINSPQRAQSSQRSILHLLSEIGNILPQRLRTRMTRIRRRDMKVASQIAEYATPSIWGNPTVTCVGSNAGV